MVDFKIKLPSLSTSRGQVPRVGGGDTWRRIRRGLGWSFGLGLAFLVFAWINLPTRAIAWRISQEAKKAGVFVDVDDVWVSPLGSVTLYDVTWHFPPTRLDERPVPFVIEELTADVSLLSYLIGTVRLDLDGTMDEGHLSGTFVQGRSETRVQLQLEELPLYAVPKLQQTLNAPLRGDIGVDVDLTAPDNEWSKATGAMTMTCSGCRIGDGETKLYVPKAQGMMASGVTVPELELGELEGTFDVVDGVATTSDFVSKSENVEIRVSGQIQFKDPFKNTRLDVTLKVFFGEELQESNENIRLMVATAGKSTQLDGDEKGGLGFRLRGSVGKPRMKGIKSKTKAEKLQAARNRAKTRKARRPAPKQAPKPAPKPAAAAPAPAPPEPQGPTAGTPVAPGVGAAATATATAPAAIRTGDEAVPPKEAPEEATEQEESEDEDEKSEDEEESEDEEKSEDEDEADGEAEPADGIQ